ncbi:MAG: HdeA/HdeB family chaperone [Caldimonas sp.]
MNTRLTLTLIAAALAATQGLAQAQTAPAAHPPSNKPLVQTSCKDYLEMDEVVKPKFIYYTVGYSKKGKPTSATFDVVDVDKIQPIVDEYCRVHLTASAYKKVMDESRSSEKTGK